MEGRRGTRASFEDLAPGRRSTVTTPAERKALNEGLFRDANERLNRGARDLLVPEDTDFVPFVCECPKPDCVNVVLLTLAEYEEIRARPKQGLASPGHEDLSIERVVAQNGRFTTTEKFGQAGEVHRETDPHG